MKDIVYFSSIPWDYFHHRQQEMMLWFSQHGYRVWFWEPNRSLFGGLEVRDLSETLYLVRNGGIRFERCSRLVNRMNSIRQSRAFTTMLRTRDIENPIVWFDRVHGVDYSRYLRSYACVYDLIDEITAFGRWKNRRMLLEIEKRVLEGCALVITSSMTLGERKAKHAGNAPLFVPNGCDTSLLSTEIARKRPHEIPVIGFCGMISQRRLDCALIDAVASLLPEYRFVLVGPRDAGAESLIFRANNVELLAPVPSGELPGLLSTFDVGFIPYRIDSGSMDYVFPKKAFEYMAAGLPVVSTPLPECLRMSEGVVCAGSTEEVAKALKDAVEHSAGIAERQRAIASENTWVALLPRLKKEIDGLANQGSIIG